MKRSGTENSDTFSPALFINGYLRRLEEKMNEMTLLQKRAVLRCLICILLLSPVAASAESVTYEYDARHRLIGAAYDDGTSFSYSYNAVGNRLQHTVAGANASASTARKVSGRIASGNNADNASTQLNQGANTNVAYNGSPRLRYSGSPRNN